MSTTKSYTPGYVVHLQGVKHNCACCGCHSTSPLLQLRWKNQVRHSAVFGCEQVARTVLFRHRSLSMHIGEAAAENLPEMSRQLQSLNQSCLRLLENMPGNISLKLYALGLFIIRTARETSAEQFDSLTDRYLKRGIQLRMARAFKVFSGEQYKMLSLRTLCEAQLDVSSDTPERLILQRRLHQMAMLSDRARRVQLIALEKQAESGGLLASHQAAFFNFLNYQLYHTVFPGRLRGDRAAAYAGLCQHFFCLKMLCALSLQLRLALDENSISALFAAWHRVAPRHAFHDNPIPAGVSLLK